MQVKPSTAVHCGCCRCTCAPQTGAWPRRIRCAHSSATPCCCGPSDWARCWCACAVDWTPSHAPAGCHVSPKSTSTRCRHSWPSVRCSWWSWRTSCTPGASLLRTERKANRERKESRTHQETVRRKHVATRELPRTNACIRSPSSRGRA